MPELPSRAQGGVRPGWRSPAARSVLWQGLGSAATLAAALWVSWRFGLAALGEFGLAKSWFDAAAAIAALGLPQGLLHLQYRLQMPAHALVPWLQRGLLLAAALCLPTALLAASFGAPLVAAVLAALPLSVGHLLARSLLLHARGPVVFGFVTALPAMGVLAGVLALDALGLGQRFLWVLLGAAWLAGLVSLGWAFRAVGRSESDGSRQELWRVSLQSWLQTALGAMLAAALLSTVALSGQDGESLGAAALALQLYQVLAVLAGYAAPLLFDHLARQATPRLSMALSPTTWRIAAVALLLVLLATALLAVAGAAPSWLLPVSLMLPAGLAAIAARVQGTLLLARGDYTELSRQAVWRLLLALCVLVPALRLLPAAAAVALALLVIETATWWRSMRRELRQVGGPAQGEGLATRPPQGMDI